MTTTPTQKLYGTCYCKYVLTPEQWEFRIVYIQYSRNMWYVSWLLQFVCLFVCLFICLLFNIPATCGTFLDCYSLFVCRKSKHVRFQTTLQIVTDNTEYLSAVWRNRPQLLAYLAVNCGMVFAVRAAAVQKRTVIRVSRTTQRKLGRKKESQLKPDVLLCACTVPWPWMGYNTREPFCALWRSIIWPFGSLSFFPLEEVSNWEIKQYQEKWLQHVQRMDTNRIPKQALQYKPKGWRDIGRPRKRWRDQFHFEDTRNREHI